MKNGLEVVKDGVDALVRVLIWRQGSRAMRHIH